MRRLACCSLLLLAPVAVWATDSSADADKGACVYASSAVHGVGPDGVTPASARTAPSKQVGGTSSGGGGDGDLLMPRVHMPKWHSFLPGMFR